MNQCWVKMPPQAKRPCGKDTMRPLEHAGRGRQQTLLLKGDTVVGMVWSVLLEQNCLCTTLVEF